MFIYLEKKQMIVNLSDIAQAKYYPETIDVEDNKTLLPSSLVFTLYSQPGMLVMEGHEAEEAWRLLVNHSQIQVRSLPKDPEILSWT